MLINLGYSLGIFLSNCLGFIVPLENKEAMKEDHLWRVVIGFPIILELYSIIAVYLFYKHPSIIDLLNGDEEVLENESENPDEMDPDYEM